MLVKISRPCLTSHGHKEPGQVADLPDAEGRMLVAIRKAVPHDGEAPPVEAPPPAPLASIDDAPADLPQADDAPGLTTDTAAAVVEERKRPGRPRKSR